MFLIQPQFCFKTEHSLALKRQMALNARAYSHTHGLNQGFVCAVDILLMYYQYFTGPRVQLHVSYQKSKGEEIMAGLCSGRFPSRCCSQAVQCNSVKGLGKELTM